MKSLRTIVAAIALLGTATFDRAAAQQDAVERELEKYRQMMKADPWSNPALLDADDGEALWKKPAGPNNVSLEKCDLGKGPGVVDGAFAALPKYFADADRVMDTETRILWCREKLQGIDNSEFLKNPHPGGGARVKEVGRIATWIASKSAGMKFAAKLDHPKEVDAVEVGKVLFNRRMGPFDFACTTCHADSGKRIRLQPLPFLSKPEEAKKVVGEWPAYRVSSTHVMTMQHRVLDCFWQMRMHRVQMGSEVSNALIAYMVKTAEGGDVAAPGMKR
ncbi:MAG: sulfur oxidation c-type cytochrome SoxA [Hyphomicrobiaceae bacterium]|nr:sulfur oxidation c-type cytochrome SoxA [Hyphomicrobiaceae bacterium]